MRKPYAWLAFVATILLALILLGFQAIWVTAGSASGIMNQTGLQRTRVELLAKDVLILEHPASAQQRAQAVSELQDTFPSWARVQAGLQTGDPSLDLPARPPSDVQLLLVGAQSDYVAIQIAMQNILAHPTTLDETQAAIVLAHERGYLAAMSQVTATWKEHIDSGFVELFWIEAGVDGTIMVVIVINFAGTLRMLKARSVKGEAHGLL